MAGGDTCRKRALELQSEADRQDACYKRMPQETDVPVEDEGGVAGYIQECVCPNLNRRAKKQGYQHRSVQLPSLARNALARVKPGSKAEGGQVGLPSDCGAGGGQGGLPSEKGAQGGHTGKGKAKLIDHEPGAEGAKDAEDAEDAAAHVIHTSGDGSAELKRSDCVKAAALAKAAAEGTELSTGPSKALGERLGRKKVDFLLRKPSRGVVPQAPQEAPRQPPTSHAEASDRVAAGSRRPLLLKPQDEAGPFSGLEAFGGTLREARAAHHGSSMIQFLDGRLGAKVKFDLLPGDLVDAFATKRHPVHSAARKDVAQAFDYLVQLTWNGSS
jgi:hypothetical protein